MNPFCECEAAGYCTRHKMYKNAVQFTVCKGLATNKENCGFNFWLAWEKGEFGATAPENPQLVMSWKCAKGRVLQSPLRQERAPRVRKTGDFLESAFSLVGIYPVTGCSCGALKQRLNNVPPEQVIENIDYWTDELHAAAKQWKELVGGIWSYVPTPKIALKEVLLYAANSAAQAIKEQGENDANLELRSDIGSASTNDAVTENVEELGESGIPQSDNLD